MDKGVQHIRDLLNIIQTKDQGDTFMNWSETEDGGEEKLLSEIPTEVQEMKDERLAPYVGLPSSNCKNGSLHDEMAIRPTIPMQCGYKTERILIVYL